MTTTDPGLRLPRSSGAAAAPVGESDRQRHERRPMLAAGVAALAACVPTSAGAALVAGMPGLYGALVGTALVLVLFGAGAAMMMWAGRRGPSAMTAVAAGGVGARLLLYAAVLMALDGADVVHRPSLAVATAVALVITLGAELTVLARTPSLFALRVPPSAAGPSGSRAASGRPPGGQSPMVRSPMVRSPGSHDASDTSSTPHRSPIT